MRPDEHKKRKNTQYKKKHGITAKDNNQDKKEKDSLAKSSDRGKSEGATKTEETKPSRPQKAQVLNSQESLLTICFCKCQLICVVLRSAPS